MLEEEKNVTNSIPGMTSSQAPRSYWRRAQKNWEYFGVWSLLIFVTCHQYQSDFREMYIEGWNICITFWRNGRLSTLFKYCWLRKPESQASSDTWKLGFILKYKYNKIISKNEILQIYRIVERNWSINTFFSKDRTPWPPGNIGFTHWRTMWWGMKMESIPYTAVLCWGTKKVP